ncbi:DUF3168 domain-containing protein [Bacillus wiedmannii]|uniref:DUF3168 domain-containing protein n=1 Tax=Bacillus wiedmannii TaxID=1890302 RepID=UPI000BF21E6F|nr:DUF3168 domain-containing protein [Bacillus wiedmannii]PEN61616.1 hypothetical protein CN576_21515 [Bacillus wiedmannii]
MATRMYEVQQKVYSRLDSDKELKKMVRGIFDYVPEKTKTPYVTFGHILSSSDGSKTDNGEKITVTLDIWSESKGRKEAVSIVNRIEKILEADVQLDTAFLITQKVTNREVWEEAPGLYHATVETEFQIEWED